MWSVVTVVGGQSGRWSHFFHLSPFCLFYRLLVLFVLLSFHSSKNKPFGLLSF